MKIFGSVKTILKQYKISHRLEKKKSANYILDKNLYPEYIQDFQNLTRKQNKTKKSFFKNGQKI